MTQRTTLRSSAPIPQLRSSFFELRTAPVAGFAAAVLLAATLGVTVPVHAQDATSTPAADASAPTSAAPATAAPDSAQPASDITLSNQKPGKTRKEKQDKVVESKETKKADKRLKKDNALAGMDTKLPDKALYDKAEDAIKHGRFDVGRIDLQTLLDAYPDSEYIMRAKLAVADSWYKEGGTAALTQAEQEYKDFITFFPNAPEAAEAQMRVGDIYFREMDKPDRDYTTTMHAEEEYRLMLQQFPDSPLVPQAQQHLREVQEVLAEREAHIADFYEQREPPNLSGAIARYQTVVDSYPLYSHMDQVLINLGDAYEAEAKMARAVKTPPNAPERYKAQLESARTALARIDDEQAAAAYDKVVLEHSAAPHVEDAKDRLAAMGRHVPTPTAEQVAASTALENSRGQYTLSKRALGLFVRGADTVPAATIGSPPLEDPPLVSAATVVRKSISDFNSAMNPAANGTAATAAPEAAVGTAESSAVAAPVQPAAGPLALEDVPTAKAGDITSSMSSETAISPSSPAQAGNSMGIEIVRPGSDSQVPVTAPASPPAFPGTANRSASTATDSSNGLMLPGSTDAAAPLAPIEKPAAAPEVINEAAGVKTPAAQTASPDGRKKPKVECDKNDESCSKHKKKKGVDKLNPF
ncbi:MAG TPA: outer membrane protein assembly factor BamD [Acidobacteriaceae bacterium]|nr:outer membrane protein assembly factor BamD [Acidobacteriaceae bacterium]